MKLQNKSTRTYQHSYYETIKDKKTGNKKQNLVIINLFPGQVAEVPQDIAELWLKADEVVEYVDPVEAKKAEEEAAKVKQALEDENAKLKAEIEKLKEEAAKKVEATKTLEELKKEADELEIEYPANIGAVRLQEKIEAKKAEEKK